MTSLSVFSQTQPSSLSRNKNKNIKYITSSRSTDGSLAVIVDEVPLAHTIQVLPLNNEGKLIRKDSLSNQIDQIFRNLAIILKKADSNIQDIVKMNICIAQADLMPKVQEDLNNRFSKRKMPAVSFVVGDIAITDALLAIDVVAASKLVVDKQVKYLRSEEIFGDSQMAHVSILPANGVVYISGQADKGQLSEATIGTLKQLDATLKYLGLKKEDVVQIKAFVSPVTSFKAVEKEINGFFAGMTTPPVVYVDWVSKDPLIEIELIVTSPKKTSNAGEQLDFITPAGMTNSPVYSKVTRINYGKKIYMSSLYGNKSDNAHAEVEEIFTSLTDILNKASSDLTHLAKATYYVSNSNTSAKLNELRPKYYDSKRPPAASKATVKGVGMSAKGVAVDMIGVVIDK